MTVRSAQVKALAQESRIRFAKNATAYIRAAYTEQALGQNAPELAGFIDQGIQMATAFGITSEVDVIRFLEVLLVTGADFEDSAEYNWVADYLREDIRPEARLDNVVQRLHFGVARPA
jgi:hypothetical protein